MILGLLMESILYSGKWAHVKNAFLAVNQDDPKFIGCVWRKEIYRVMVILGLSLEALGLLLP